MWAWVSSQGSARCISVSLITAAFSPGAVALAFAGRVVPGPHQQARLPDGARAGARLPLSPGRGARGRTTHGRRGPAAAWLAGLDQSRGQGQAGQVGAP